MHRRTWSSVAGAFFSNRAGPSCVSQRMGKQTFLIISLLAVLGVAALGALLVSGRSEVKVQRPGVERSQPMVEGGALDR